MKAIIVAAGAGSRLVPHTNGMPKCLLHIGGQTILQRALGALRINGVSDIAVVKGYCGHMIDYRDVTYYDNTDFSNNNILRSLFYAEDEMTDDFIFSYSDILYSGDVVAGLVKNEGDVVLTVDANWKQAYEGRHMHPISEAELVKVEDGLVKRIGKDVVVPGEAYGEFIGLAKFTKSGAETMKSTYHRIAKSCSGQPFQHAISLEKAYLTDMIQELIDHGVSVHSYDISGGWMEIETPQDLDRARTLDRG